MGRIRERVVGPALLATLALAGCASPSPPPGAPAEGSGDPSDVLTYADCSEHAGFFPVSASEAAAWLPAGYPPALPADAPIADAAAVLLVVGFTCERAVGLMLAVTVAPPEDQRAPEGVANVALLGLVANDPDRIGSWRAWGSRVIDDPALTVGWDETAQGVSRGATRALGVVELDTIVEGEPGPSAEDGLRLFVVDDARTVPGYIDLVVESGGRSVGTFTSQEATAGEATLRVSGAPLWGAVGGPRTGVAHHIWDEPAWRAEFTALAPAGAGR